MKMNADTVFTLQELLLVEFRKEFGAKRRTSEPIGVLSLSVDTREDFKAEYIMPDLRGWKKWCSLEDDPVEQDNWAQTYKFYDRAENALQRLEKGAQESIDSAIGNWLAQEEDE